jgi:hypothetical protein
MNLSDSIISEYSGAFQRLKERFILRSGLTTLKVFHDVRQGAVRLSDTLEEIKDIGGSFINE